MPRDYISKAMIVESDNSLRESYSIALENVLLPDEVIFHSSPENALGMIREGKVHLDDIAVVSMSSVPSETMSYRDFFSQLRQQEYMGPVMLITADHKIQPSQDIPIVIQKPFKVDDVTTKILSCMEQHEKRSMGGKQ